MRAITPKYLMVLFIMFTLLIWASCKPTDTKILKDAQAKVSVVDPSVEVEVKEGIVTLSGQVLDDATRMNVENAVKEVNGVRSVVNNVVTTPPPPAPEPVAANDDLTITDGITAGLKARGISGVTVAVLNGEVTLSGYVNRSDTAAIMQVANETKPVHVVNKLRIR